MEKPKEPRPEGFGLTADRLLLFKRPSDDRIVDRIENVLFALALLFFAIVAGSMIWRYMTDASFKSGELFFGFLGLIAFIIPVVMFAGALVFRIVESIWKHMQADYPAFKSYQKAISEYQQQLERWFRDQESWWQSLDGGSFEAELAGLLQKRGYDVCRTGASGDEGVDLILKQDDRRIAIQCKAHKHPVGPGPVRDLYGTLMHRKDTEAWLISTSGFSRGAEEFASGKPIRLLTIGAILRGGLY